LKFNIKKKKFFFLFLLGVDYFERKIPSALQFRSKINGNNRGLIFYYLTRLSTIQNFTLEIPEISDNLDYSLYFMFTSDNPGPDATHSEV
jgi:hypothetical protein